MKLPLLLLTFFVSTFVFAQNTRQNLVELHPGARFFVPGKPPALSPKDTLKSEIIASLTDIKKPGLYRLPQDGMPCSVPDAKELAVMPNAFKGEVRVPFSNRSPEIPNIPRSFQYRKK